MKKLSKKSLTFQPETLRVLRDASLAVANGGGNVKSNVHYNTCADCPGFMPQ